MPTDCGVKPIIETDSSSAVEMACANCSASESAGIPRNAALMSSSALSGSRKKSPETATSDSRTVRHLDVDRDQFSTRNLVLSTHPSSLSLRDSLR